jgi:hypothetical protein
MISFLHGKLNGLLEDSMEEKGTILHPWEMVDIARKNDIPIFYCFHPCMKPGFTIGWNHAIEMQKSLNVDVTFEAGSWQVFKIRWIATGVGDVAVSNHSSSSRVAAIRNTTGGSLL